MTATKSNELVEANPSDSLRTRVAIGAFWALVGAVISRGLTLASSVFAGRMLGTTGFGEVTMIQSTQGMLGVLAGAGMGLAATKFVAACRSVDIAKAGRFVNVSVMISVVTGFVGATALFAGSHWLADNVISAPHLANEMAVGTGMLFFGTISGVQNGAIIGLGNFRVVAILNIIRGACLCVLLIVGIELAGVMGGVIGLVVTEGIAVIINQIAIKKLLPDLRFGFPSGAEAWDELKSMGRFSLLALAGSVCTILGLWYANVVLVNQENGYAALGIFNAADRWRQLLLFLPATISPLILSMLSNLHGKNDPTGYRQLVSVNLWVSAGVVVLPAAVVALGAPLAMGIFGEEYTSGSMTLVILAFSSISVVLNNVLGQILVSQGAIWGRFVLDVLLAAVLALASWLLIPLYREQGMAISSLIAYSVAALALIPPAMWFMKNTNLASDKAETDACIP